MLSTLVDKMNNTPWIVPPVKNVTLRKATRMGLVMASFPEVGGGFVRSYLETYRYFTSRIYSDNATDNFTTGVANAFYSGGTNAMTIQAGIVQPPMYFPDGTAALNYGGLGQVIGHEIMHAYDVEGIMRDDASRSAGFRTNASTLVEYERKVLCLRKSYEDYEKNARQLDDTIDSEGFADYSGLQLAYAAYRGLPASERDERVPDVPLSAEKTFFVAHCLKWCDLIKKRSQGSLYWAGRSRCIVPLQNMPEFAAAFGCRSGDLMNPPKRCDFW
ncbi:hypothetical protein HPB50_011495 [Hyalomma asiaticum]|uniref:Uncharacterized protein n=1 Tax=Hyalomma asiaticum TaxID=266040 RepID=A0ACB7RT59_HYAAI|nr:hypothetical protein HPB50_011495 [Hyalomma asiaticum]